MNDDKVQFKCSGCNKTLNAPAEKAGKTAKCPACGVALQIPNTSTHYDDAPPTGIRQSLPQATATTPGGDAEKAAQPPLEKINFPCAGCGKAIVAPADRAGKTGKCPACGAAIEIPQTPSYYKTNLMAACAAIGKAAELRDSGEEERAKKGFALAETWVREVLQTPCLPFAIEADAHCLLGTCCKSVGRFAEARTALEKGLALGRSRGFMVMEEWFYADDLGDVYDGDVHKLIIDGQLDQAKVLLAQVEDFVSHYKALDKFDWVRHEGFLILARAMIAGNEQRLDAALQHFGQLISAPYTEHFASQPSISFVVGQAARNIGQIYHMAYGRSDEAIPYLEESLKYYQPGSDELASAQMLLDRVRMKRGLLRAISVGWDQVPWGTSMNDFFQTFPQARRDEEWWLSGEESGDLAGFTINEVKYAFNQDGQLYLIALFPNESSRLFKELPYVLGASDERGTAGWTFGTVEMSIKAQGCIVLLINSAFDDGGGG